MNHFFSKFFQLVLYFVNKHHSRWPLLRLSSKYLGNNQDITKCESFSIVYNYVILVKIGILQETPFFHDKVST